MKKHAWWSLAIGNSICMICWTVLAVIFNKWWIALFGLLFMSSCKSIQGHYRICNKCGKHSEYAATAEEALKKAEAAGWVHYHSTNTDFCPECYKKDTERLWEHLK